MPVAIPTSAMTTKIIEPSDSCAGSDKAPSVKNLWGAELAYKHTAANQMKKSTCQTWQDEKQITCDSLENRIKCVTDTNLILSFKWLHLACLKVAGLDSLPSPRYSLKNAMPCFPLSVVEYNPTHFPFHQV